MRSDPASFMSNLFLFHYEEKWTRKTKRKDLTQAKKYSSMFRFLDDLASIDNGGEFERVYHEIYATELQLKRKNRSYTETSLLDVDINVVNEQFS